MDIMSMRVRIRRKGRAAPVKCPEGRTVARLLGVVAAVLFLRFAAGFGLFPAGADERIPSAATLFTVERGEGWTLLRNRLPWIGGEGELAWVLVEDEKTPLPEELALLPRIRVPVRRVLAMTIPTVSALELLGELETLVGVGGGRFLYSPAAKAKNPVEVGPEGGMGTGSDFERIVALRPDVVFAYAYTSQEQESALRLRELGVPVVFLSEYLEATPLARAEWIVFLAHFFGRGAEGEAFFRDVAARYENVRTIAATVRARPVVMTGAPFRGTWYIGGGESWPARLIADAGGRYLWSDLPGSVSVPFDGEAVFARSGEAEYWINCGQWKSREDAVRDDPRHALFRPFREGRLYNNDLRSNATGGNDYYESAVWRPDLVLADLAALLHPELFPEHAFFYYRLLPERGGTAP
jgi:iron complex transport system substrate-binding protein